MIANLKTVGKSSASRDGAANQLNDKWGHRYSAFLQLPPTCTRR